MQTVNDKKQNILVKTPYDNFTGQKKWFVLTLCFCQLYSRTAFGLKKPNPGRKCELTIHRGHTKIKRNLHKNANTSRTINQTQNLL